VSILLAYTRHPLSALILSTTFSIFENEMI